MNPHPYTEDTLVQQTTADYMEQQLGWESVYACDRGFRTRPLAGLRLRPRKA
jgi:hypothetical protein